MPEPTYDHVPEWCRPGAEVVDITSSGSGTARSAGSPVTVERITKTQVVVRARTGEARFRCDGPDRRPYKRSPNQFGATRYLASADAADVKAAQRDADLRRATREVEKLAMEWRNGGALRHSPSAVEIAETLVKAGVISSYTLPDTDDDKADQ